MAKAYPNLMEASKLDPIAKPSGKLCKAKPMLTIIPVFSKDALYVPMLYIFSFFGRMQCAPTENFFCTIASQKIIQNTPSKTPKIVPVTLLISKLSGIKSKQTIESISPDASDKIKLRKRLDVSLKDTPMIPPIIVPKVPKNRPTNVIFNNSFINLPQWIV